MAEGITGEGQVLPTLHETISALSFALDLTEGAVPGHALRSCLLAMRLGSAIGLRTAELDQLYYAALLKDAGCSSNAARMCQIVGGDDRRVKAGAKLADWTQMWKPDLRTLKMLWNEVLPGEPGWRKAARIARIGAAQNENNRELIEMRCDRGAQIVRAVGLDAEVAQGVRHLDEHWDGGGYPGHKKGLAIPFISRILGVSQHLDAFRTERGAREALETLEARSGRWFDPSLVKVARGLERAGELWIGCEPQTELETVHDAVLAREPEGMRGALPPEGLKAICNAFASVVDAKSPYTWIHSQGVRAATVAIADVLGLSPERREMLSRAALLHDLGKLSVPNSILDKPGKLTHGEFTVVKGHPGLSGEILGRLSAFEEIAAVARNHHERLDGSGYPLGLQADQLGTESRLLAVADVYAALSEERPYREGLDFGEIVRIMSRDVPVRLDPMCFEALKGAVQTGKLGSKPSATESLICLGCSHPAGIVQEPVPAALLAGGTNQHMQAGL